MYSTRDMIYFNNSSNFQLLFLSINDLINIKKIQLTIENIKLKTATFYVSGS